jgi:hypothetical protein
MKALLIPADDFRDVEVISITADQVGQANHGWPKRARYDHDTAFSAGKSRSICQ